MAGTNSGTLADRRSNRRTIGAKVSETMGDGANQAVASLKEIEDHGVSGARSTEGTRGGAADVEPHEPSHPTPLYPLPTTLIPTADQPPSASRYFHLVTSIT
jgi:hypothetical protein